MAPSKSRYSEIALQPMLSSSSGQQLTKKYREQRQRFQGWRLVVYVGVSATFVVFCINLALFIWTYTKPLEDVDNPSLKTIYRSSPRKVNRANEVAHVFINALSIVLLGTSFTCMLRLGAPTRQEIDKAHNRGHWLDVGIPSLRNLGWISWKRSSIFILLALSSLPLHFFYNSVIFVTSYTYKLHPILVASDFTSGHPWNLTASIIDQCLAPSDLTVQRRDPNATDLCQPTDHAGSFPQAGQLAQLQKSVSSLERLNQMDCFQYLDRYASFAEDYNTTGFSIGAMPQYKTMFLISPVSNESNAVLRVFNSARTCPAEAGICTPDNWSVDFDVSSGTSPSIRNATEVQYCLAERGNALPALQCSPQLLGVVAICNLIKLVCFAIALRMHHKPLVTIGDAIASFLYNPDSRTAGQGALSAEQLKGSSPIMVPTKDSRAGLIISENPTPMHCFRLRQRRWYSAVALQRGLISVSGIMILWLAPLFAILFFHGGDVFNFGGVDDRSAATSFDKTRTAFLNHPGNTIDVLTTINSPHLALTFGYRLFNDLLSILLVSDEFCRYAVNRKTLRASVPVDKQRGSYFLSQPFRYAIPLTCSMGLLHWFVSQGFRFSHTQLFDYNDKFIEESGINGITQSPLACLLAIVLCVLMLSVALGLSFRKLSAGAPIVRTNSLAIAAACHRADYEDVDIISQPLKFGILNCYGSNAKRRVGFSAHHVDPLSSDEHE